MKKISKFASEFSKIKFGQQLANKISIEEISQQPVGQITWRTLITIIIPRSKSHEKMLWYINQTHNKEGINNE